MVSLPNIKHDWHCLGCLFWDNHSWFTILWVFKVDPGTMKNSTFCLLCISHHSASVEKEWWKREKQILPINFLQARHNFLDVSIVFFFLQLKQKNNNIINKKQKSCQQKAIVPDITLTLFHHLQRLHILIYAKEAIDSLRGEEDNFACTRS